MYLLRLFGGATLEDASGPLRGRAAQRRRLALLAILALEHPRAVGRDRLIAWLWPEANPDRARHLLRDSLYLIRNALGEDCLFGGGDELRLNPECIRCDVWEFADALAHGRPEAAERAYAGPLLDGVHIGDAPELEHWLDAERERFARSQAKVLEQLAEQASEAGDAKGAVEWWRRLAAGDPYNSRIALRLMEALAASGDRAGAIRHARIHASLLDREFEAEPDPEVVALAEQLRTDPPQRAAAEPVRDGDSRRGTEQVEPIKGLLGAIAVSPTDDEVTVPTAVTDDPPSTALRPARPHLHRRAMTVATAGVIALVTAFAVIDLLPEMTAHPGAAPEAAPTPAKSIAVLPCVNLSADPDEEYFSDGLTEALIGVLAQVGALQVVARTSAFAYKGQNRDIREIGEALNVGTLLECSVRRDGERVRVTAQLINATDGFHLWAETYEREGTDVFAIQTDLALRIASALDAELTPVERARLARRPTTNPAAHTHYQRGRHFWNQRTSHGYARAIESFERAIDADPEYAAAYAGLAMVYSLQGLHGDLVPQEARERMRNVALKALELDDGLAEAHAALGAYLNVYGWDSQASERAYRRAIELDPGYGTARHLYGNLLGAMGRLEEAIAEKQKAVELDPLAPQLSNSLGRTLLWGGRTDEGVVHIRNALELDSTFWAAHASLGDHYASTGRFEDAIRVHQRAVELAGANPEAKIRLARTRALAGQEAEARALLAELRAEAARTGIYPPALATVFPALDDPNGVEEALAWLEHSYRQRHPGLRFINRGDEFGRLVNDPRFRELRPRVGLPP